MTRIGILRPLVLSAVFAAGLALSGCDSARLDQFSSFAAAGTVYVTACHTFLADAGTAFLAGSSAALVGARQMAAGGQTSDPSFYRKNLLRDDQEQAAYLRNLQVIDNHAALLGAYFAAITTLTSDENATAAATRMDGLADAIAAFNPQVGSLKFGEKEVASFLEPASKLVVAHFAVKALDANLSRNAKVIDEALSLQEAAVAAISQQMKAALEASLNEEEVQQVVDPYLAAGPLTRAWAARREAYIRRRTSVTSAGAAEKAIRKLHDAFRTLVASKDAKVDFPGLVQSIGQMAGFSSAASQ